jgi:hypothetical protein
VINDLKLLKDLQNFYFIISIKLISFKVESLTKVWLVGSFKVASLRIFFLPDLLKFEVFVGDEEYREASRQTSSWFSFCW